MGDKFAVFDMDREYIEKFSSYVSRKENFPFQFAAYSDIEVFIRQYKNVEVLLVSDQAMRKEELKKSDRQQDKWKGSSADRRKI